MSANEKLQTIKGDLLTVPNALTASRLIALPFLYRAVKLDPARHWVKAGVVASSDKLDGLAAKQEDKGGKWAQWGFRRSKSGRIGDPVVDTIFSASMIDAGEKSGAVPKPISRAAKIQKFGKTLVSAYGTARGKEIHVNYTGKLGEAETALGIGFLLGSTGIERPVRRYAARAASCAITAMGIGKSAVATVDYARQAEILPPQPSELERRLEAYSETLVTMPARLMDNLRGIDHTNQHSN